MKSLILLIVLVSVCQSLDLKDYLRMRCSLDPNETTLTYWTGTIYSNIPQEYQQPLFNFYGVNMMRCFQDDEGQWYQTSRELSYYLDQETNLPIDTWVNPYTNETNVVMHVANNPVQNPLGDDSTVMDSTIIGDQTVLNLDINLLYPNVLYGDSPLSRFSPYKYYQASEIFGLMTSSAAFSSDSKSLPLTFKWTRSSLFLPWMNMGDKQGNLLFSCIGGKTTRDQLPDWLNKEIQERLPLYLEAPKCYLDKENETSWTKFRDQFEQFKQGKKFPIEAPVEDFRCAHEPKQSVQSSYFRTIKQ